MLSAIIMTVLYFLGYLVICGGVLCLYADLKTKRMAAIYGPNWELELAQFINPDEVLWFGRLKQKYGVLYDVAFTIVWPVAFQALIIVSDIQMNKLAAKFLKKAEG